MAREQQSTLGSGTIPYLDPILHTTLGGIATELPNGSGPGQGRGQRGGTQIILANPEDVNSAPAFASSGITVGTTATQIWSPDLHEPNVLRRRRTMRIQNLGANDIYVGHADNVTVGLTQSAGWQIPSVNVGGSVTNDMNFFEIPIMGGVSVYAIADGGTSDIRILVY